MATKRRLTVVATGPEPVPPMMGHWALATAALAFALWLPLVLLALWVAQAVTPWVATGGGVVVILLLLLGSFAGAAGLAGAMVRGTARTASRTETMVGGAFAGVVSCALAVVGGSLSSWPLALTTGLVLALVGAGGAGLGGWLGFAWGFGSSARVDPPGAEH